MVDGYSGREPALTRSLWYRWKKNRAAAHISRNGTPSPTPRPTPNLVFSDSASAVVDEVDDNVDNVDDEVDDEVGDEAGEEVGVIVLFPWAMMIPLSLIS